MKKWLDSIYFDSGQQITEGHFDEKFDSVAHLMTKNQVDKLKMELTKNRKMSRARVCRYLLEFLKPNSEYDLIVVVERLRLFIQTEVKSLTIDEEKCSMSETKRYFLQIILP